MSLVTEKIGHKGGAGSTGSDPNPMRKDRMDATGTVVLVTFSAALGLNQVLVKLVNAGMEPIFQAGLRSFFAAFVVTGFALWRGKRLSVTDGTLMAGIITGTLFGIEFLMLFKGIEFTSVARASVLFYTMPAWLAVAAHFLMDDPLTRARIVGLACAIGGVVLALGWQSAEAGPNGYLGDLLCLAASLFWAAIAVIARITALSRSSPYMQMVYQLVVSAPILLLAATVPGDYLTAMTPGLWAVFAFQVIGVVSIGFLSWFWVLSVYPAAAMASFSFLAPVFGVFFGWAILGEAIGWNVIAALVLVGAGIVLVNRPRRS